MNYRSCAPLLFKRNLFQGSVHRIFNATSSWPAFDEALTTCKNVWKKNQYPEEFIDGIVLDILEKCRERRSNSVGNAHRDKEIKKDHFIIQYRGRVTDQFVQKLRKLIPIQPILTTNKLKNLLPSLKSGFSRMLKS